MFLSFIFKAAVFVIIPAQTVAYYNAGLGRTSVEGP